ncbi:MAG: hypothetical protein AAF639_18015 [Chloroflexota bacterium]
MNLKLKRLVRTSHSEQYALFDLDHIQPPKPSSAQSARTEGNQPQTPVTIGKFDLHYTNEGAYGTLLMWGASTRSMGADERRAFIYALIDDIVQPMGVPGDYVIEFFMPELDQYEVFHNVGIDNVGIDNGGIDNVGIDKEGNAALPNDSQPALSEPSQTGNLLLEDGTPQTTNATNGIWRHNISNASEQDGHKQSNNAADSVDTNRVNIGGVDLNQTDTYDARVWQRSR